jgi:hypothetical protein
MQSPRKLGLLVVALILVGLSLSLGSNVPQSEAAFGTSPPWVRNDHLLPGSTYEQIVNLSRNDPDQDMKVNIRVTGDKEISQWLKIENQNRLVMKAGDNILPMNVIVTVPKKAAIKDYKGGIFVTLEPVAAAGQQGGTVAITLGANISVELSVVGTKVENFRIQSISLNPIEEGQPFVLMADLENLGNTEIDSLNGQVDIYDEKETQVLKSLPFGTLSQSVSPDEKAKIQISFGDFKLDPGNYWVKVKVYKGTESIYENRLYEQVTAKVVPVVTPEDVLAKKPSLPKLSTGEEVTPPPVSTTNLAPLMPAAPAAPSAESKLLLIFGLVGLGFGLLAMIGVIVVLVIVIRSQRQANLERYLASQMKNNP